MCPCGRKTNARVYNCRYGRRKVLVFIPLPQPSATAVRLRLLLSSLRPPLPCTLFYHCNRLLLQCHPTTAATTSATAVRLRLLLSSLRPTLPCTSFYHCNRLLLPLCRPTIAATAVSLRLLPSSLGPLQPCTLYYHCCRLLPPHHSCYIPPTFTQNQVSGTTNRCSYVFENRSEYN